MLQAQTVHPEDLTQADIAAWRAIVAATPAFASPLLGPDFAQGVGRVRNDARVAIFRRAGEAIGFLPHHRRPGGYSRPIGAPLSDYHGLVARRDSGLQAGEALAAAGLSAYRFTSLLDPFGAFGGSIAAIAPGYIIDLNGSAADYLEALRAAGPKRFKNFRRLDSKLDREVGPVTLTGPSTSEADFETLIRWKHEQLIRTGGADFLRPDWTRTLLRNFFDKREGDFQGLMITLHAGDQLVAGHFGVRYGDRYHPWIASNNPDLGAYSPGQTFLNRAIAAMPDMGLRIYDLATTHDHYKRPFCLTTVNTAEGVAAAANTAGRMVERVDGVWTMAGSRRTGLVGRLRRRLDAIATTELNAVDRTRAFIDAVAAQTRRRAATDLE